LCNYDHCESQLYQRYGRIVEEYLTTTVVPSIDTKIGQGSLVYIFELQKIWTRFNNAVKRVRKAFRLLDKHYVKRKALPTLTSVGINLFQSIVLSAKRQTIVEAVVDFFAQKGTFDVVILTSIVQRWFKGIETGSPAVYDQYQDDVIMNVFRVSLSKMRQVWMEETIYQYLMNVECIMVVIKFCGSIESDLQKVLHDEILEKARGQLVPKFCQTVFESDEEKFKILHKMLRLYNKLHEGWDPTSASTHVLCVHLAEFAIIKSQEQNGWEI
jgi:hypothetical protein